MLSRESVQKIDCQEAIEKLKTMTFFRSGVGCSGLGNLEADD